MSAWVSSARIERIATIRSGVSSTAEAGEISSGWFVLAHGSAVAGCWGTAGLFFLTLETGIPSWASTSVALDLILTSSSVVARTRGAVIDVNLAKLSRETSWAVARSDVGLRLADPSVLTESFFASDNLALIPALGSWFGRHTSKRAL